MNTACIFGGREGVLWRERFAVTQTANRKPRWTLSKPVAVGNSPVDEATEPNQILTNGVNFRIMLLVSWNVAGLKPALQRIHSDYGASSTTTTTSKSDSNNNKNASKNKSFDPFANYLRLHGDVDILCIQEHKIPLTQLSSSAEPFRCSSIEGYESFWSCATDQKSRGFNGVVTYVKRGFVQGADSTPFKDPELDNQGRCVMTNHGKLVIFNVYVPCGNGPNKIKFLNALSDAMDRQRLGGKHVILMGDLNLKIDKRDVFYLERVLNVNQIMEEVEQDESNHLPFWKRQIVEKWSNIETALKTIEVIPRQTTNPTTKETFEKFRARITIAENQFVWLGSFEDTQEQALSDYNFEEQSYIDPVSSTAIVCRKKNLLSVRTLAELMNKVSGVQWDDKIQRAVGNSEDANLNTDSPSFIWMKALLEGDNRMVDVFRYFYPAAEERFTCWHQFTQRRYVNEGSRIDFTLVDISLMKFVEPSDGKSLRCGTDQDIDPLGKEAALSAATANGLFEPGSFAGGGIAIATKRALDTQFGLAHTGMIYTPPSYSDHIAVSLLMKESFRELIGTLDLLNDAPTRNAQPHKKQRSISSFFASSSSSSSSSSVSTKSATSREKRKGLQEAKSSKESIVTSFFKSKSEGKRCK